MPPKRRKRSDVAWDTRGDVIWKWLLRLSALAAFFYVLIARDGNVPMGVYVIIGGFAGLPNILALQQILNRTEEDSSGSAGGKGS
jgi:hypothetical protein